MQRKLLFLSILSCIFIQAEEVQKDEIPIQESQPSLSEDALKKFQKVWEETQGTPAENLNKYREIIYKRFEMALVRSLSDDPKAIATQFEENTQENKETENTQLQLIDDSKPGYFPTPATNKSMNGFLKENEQQLTKAKDEENAQHRDRFTQFHNRFNQNIRPYAIEKLKDRRYMVMNHYLAGLQACGNDQKCLTGYDVDWQKINQADFLNGICNFIYNDIYTKVEKNAIPLTYDQVVHIVSSIQLPNEELSDELKNKTLIQQIAIAKAKVIEEIDFILHPEKRVKIEGSIPSSENNNDKGSSSQSVEN